MNDKMASPGRNSEWMVAYVTNNITEAHIIAGRLKSEGIHAILDHMAGMGAIGITIGNWGEIRILVHPENYDQAVDILDNEYGLDELPEQLGDVIYDHYDEDDDMDDEDHDKDE